MFKNLSIMVAAAAMVIAINVPTIQDADAKSYGRSSFSSSSYSRSSYRSSSGSKSSSSKSMFSSYKSKSGSSTKTASKNTTKKSTTKTTSSKFGKGKSASYNTVSSGKQTKAAKASLTKQRSKFKKQPKAKTVNKDRYAKHGAYASARKANPATYHTRRNAYYAGYTTPTYVYGMSPSYGLWDTIFLYSMLSSINNNNHAGQFAHNYSNDADYQNWRREADVLARDNAELRAQLASLDSQSSQFAGNAVDPNYMPDGVDADIAMSQEALTSLKPTLRVCTGAQSGAYFRLTAGVLAPSINSVNMVAVTTSGTGEIIQKIADGSCDAGFVQGDGYWNYVETHQTDNLPFERVFSPYKESVHLVCNEDGPSTVADLTSKNKVWFPKNSGAAITWANFIGESDKYGKVPTVLSDSSMAVNSYEEAIMKVSNDPKSCAVYVAAQGSTTLMRDIDSGAVTTKMVLIDIEDGKLDNTTDPSGKDVYDFTSLSKYKSLLRQGGCYGYCSGDVTTLSVNADFIVADAWKKANSSIYSNLAVELVGMSGEITTAVKQ